MGGAAGVGEGFLKPCPIELFKGVRTYALTYTTRRGPAAASPARVMERTFCSSPHISDVREIGNLARATRITHTHCSRSRASSIGTWHGDTSPRLRASSTVASRHDAVAEVNHAAAGSDVRPAVRASHYDSAMTRKVSTVTLGSGLTLSYAEQGDRSGPTLVLLPGPTDSWLSYQPALERIPPSIRTIAVSQRGHGDSDKPATGYRVEDFAADVVPLLDALRIERAVLAGHSGSCLVKNDVADATDLADMWRLNRLPEAWIAPPALRELVRYRAKLVKLRSGLKSQVHAVMAKEGVLPKVADIFCAKGNAPARCHGARTQLRAACRVPARPHRDL